MKKNFGPSGVTHRGMSARAGQANSTHSGSLALQGDLCAATWHTCVRSGRESRAVGPGASYDPKHQLHSTVKTMAGHAQLQSVKVHTEFLKCL